MVLTEIWTAPSFRSGTRNRKDCFKPCAQNGGLPRNGSEAEVLRKWRPNLSLLLLPCHSPEFPVSSLP